MQLGHRLRTGITVGLGKKKNMGGGIGLVTKSCPTLETPWTVALQAPLSMEFSRQVYWSGLPLPTPGKIHFPTQGLSPCLLYCNSQDLPFSLQRAGSLVVACELLVVTCRT